MFQRMATHIQATLIGLNGLKKQKDMKLWGEGGIRDVQEELDGRNERGCDQERCLFVWNSQRINKKHPIQIFMMNCFFPSHVFIDSFNKQTFGDR